MIPTPTTPPLTRSTPRGTSPLSLHRGSHRPFPALLIGLRILVSRVSLLRSRVIARSSTQPRHGRTGPASSHTPCAAAGTGTPRHRRPTPFSIAGGNDASASPTLHRQGHPTSTSPWSADSEPTNAPPPDATPPALRDLAETLLEGDPQRLASRFIASTGLAPTQRIRAYEPRSLMDTVDALAQRLGRCASVQVLASRTERFWWLTTFHLRLETIGTAGRQNLGLTGTYDTENDRLVALRIIERPERSSEPTGTR